MDPSQGEYAVWAGIPDGLGAYRDGTSLILHTNHELSATGIATGQPAPNDRAFKNARVSRLVIDLATLAVTGGSYPVKGSYLLSDCARGVAAGDWASPDNVAAGKKSLMVQEDPAYPEFNRPERIWDFQFNADGTLAAPQAVVELTTEQQTGKVCSDAAGTCWESSGIIDASEWLGAGTWLFDVQAHTLPIFKVKSDGSYELGADGQPLKLTNNESGQLLYLRVPGTCGFPEPEGSHISRGGAPIRAPAPIPIYLSGGS